MSKILGLLILFSLLAKTGSAKNYYFSTTLGDDAYTPEQAQNPLTPWKSLQKLNIYFFDLNPGDSVLLKRGEIFKGSITIKNNSGSPTTAITIGAYGTGAKPLITGLIELSFSGSTGNNVYKSLVSKRPYILTINGIEQAVGRYPNSGYLTYQSHIVNNSIKDSKSNSSINWTGADIAIRKNRWIIDVSKITMYAGGNFRYAPGTGDEPTNGYGYFIQNDLRTLDAFGEWYFDAVNKSLSVFFGTENPKSYSVKTSIVDTLVNINGNGFITFDNIAFEGAGKNAFHLLNAEYITIRNCDIKLSGSDAINGSSSTYLTIENCNINNSLNNGIKLDSASAFAVIKYNKISQTGRIPGMGSNGTGGYSGIISFGSNTLIEYNEIDSTGYNGIYLGGNHTIVKNNLINYFCTTLDDGAGVYVGDWSPWTGKKIIGNIILNGIGAAEGTNTTTAFAEGIYIDDNSANTEISSNTIANCFGAGIKIHNAHDILVRNNTVFNNSTQLFLNHDNKSFSTLRNVISKGNVFFSKTLSQSVINYTTISSDFKNFGVNDSNYYAAPFNYDLIFHTKTPLDKQTGVSRTLQDFGKYLGTDVNSKKSPVKNAVYQAVLGEQITIAPDDYIRFEYNATDINKIIQLSRTYLDAKNTCYSGTVVLKPYSSIILMPNDCLNDPK